MARIEELTKESVVHGILPDGDVTPVDVKWRRRQSGLSAQNDEAENRENNRSMAERHDAVISAAAFATSRGGQIRFGVGASGERVGLVVGEKTLEELANYFKANTDPPVFPSITIEGDPSDAVITARVEESPLKPVWAFGTPYKRVGRTNQKISREETERLSDASRGMTWDALPCDGLGLDDLDRMAVEEYLRRAGQDTATSTETVLATLKLVSGGALLNGAALLFAADPQRWIVGSMVQCARFRGSTSVDFLDERTIRANVLQQIDEALTFISRNTRQAIRITGRAQRDIVAQYSTEAVREAVINAVCHRDYASSGTVQVRIYEDRLEVWNPGALPPALTIGALFKEHASYPRNKRLAEAFHRADLIERWGTGTLRMIEACAKNGQPTPEFAEVSGAFVVRLRPPDPAPVGARAQRSDERLIRGLRFIAQQGTAMSSEYAKAQEISPRQAKRELAALLARGWISRIGSGSSTRYVPSMIGRGLAD